MIKKVKYGLVVCTFISLLVLSFFVYMYQVTALSPIRSIVPSSGVITQNNTGNLTRLHTEGRYIKDANGNIVILRGVNRGHFEHSPSGDWGDWNVFDQNEMNQELDNMKSWGINVVRLYTSIEWWIDNTQAQLRDGGTTSHRDVVKTIIEALASRGMYAVYVPWNVGGNGEQDPLPYPPHTTHSEVIGSTEDFVNYWSSVAAELGSYSNVIFELYNEPGNNMFPTAEDEQTWFDTVQQCINTIREITDNLIVVSWRSVYYDRGHNSGEKFDFYQRHPLTGSNLVYTVHIYIHGYGYNPPSTTYDEIKEAFTWENLNQQDVPLWIGEIGASLGTGDDTGELTRFENGFKIFNEWGIGYAAWEWWSGNQWQLVYNVWGNDPSSGYPMDYPTESGQILKDAIIH